MKTLETTSFSHKGNVIISCKGNNNINDLGLVEAKTNHSWEEILDFFDLSRDGSVGSILVKKDGQMVLVESAT